MCGVIGYLPVSEKTPRLAPARNERHEFRDGDRIALIV
jgi:hypothetical protein